MENQRDQDDKDIISITEWWGRSRFIGRAVQCFIDGEVASTNPIPDHIILCDLCCKPIEKFPVAIVIGYAYCERCYQKALQRQKMRQASTQDSDGGAA